MSKRDLEDTSLQHMKDFSTKDLTNLQFPDASLAKSQIDPKVVSNVYVHGDEDVRLNTTKSLNNGGTASNASLDGGLTQVNFLECEFKDLKDSALYEEDLDFMQAFVGNVEQRKLQLERIENLEAKEAAWLQVGQLNKDLNVE